MYYGNDLCTVIESLQLLFIVHSRNGKGHHIALNRRSAPVKLRKVSTGFLVIALTFSFQACGSESFYEATKHLYLFDTPIAAANRPDVEVIDINSGPVLSDARGWNDITPLHWASIYGYDDVAKQLIDEGADVNVRIRKHSNLRTGTSAPDSGSYWSTVGTSFHIQGFTPLHFAVAAAIPDTSGRRARRLAIAKLLIDKGADVNAKSEHGNTPLHDVDDEAAAELLIDKGAKINAKNNGDTPLHMIMNEAVAKFLIGKGADVNAKDANGRTPLHYAAYRGFADVVRLLLDKDADVNAKDDEGKTPLHYAIPPNNYTTLSNNKVVVKLLKARGATE